MNNIEKLEKALQVILTNFPIECAIAQEKIEEVYMLSMEKLERLEELIEEIKNEYL